MIDLSKSGYYLLSIIFIIIIIIIGIIIFIFIIIIIFFWGGGISINITIIPQYLSKDTIIINSASFSWLFLEGHALAKRLSKQISQATKTLHTAVEEFNKVDRSTHWPLPRSLQVDEVKNPEADLWLRTEFIGSSSPVPISVKRKSVDLYNLLDRAKEEITLLQADMKNVIDHFSEQHAIFSTSLADATSRGTSVEAKGRVVYISMKLLSLESHLVHLHHLFQSHIHEISLPTFLFDKDDLPMLDDSETEEDNGTILSLPEQCCDSESEYESESKDESDSAFFSLVS